MRSYSRLSPLLQKCCLRLSANESYQNAEQEILALTGVKVSHSTLQRRVLDLEYGLPDAKQAICEVSIDGGKVRRRGRVGEKSYWRDYKAVRLQGIYYGAFFQDNLSLTDWINTQRLANPLMCLGDGHDGVWNLFQNIGATQQRQEILDWYHLNENLLHCWRFSQAVKTSFCFTLARSGRSSQSAVHRLPPQAGSKLLCLFGQASSPHCRL